MKKHLLHTRLSMNVKTEQSKTPSPSLLYCASVPSSFAIVPTSSALTYVPLLLSWWSSLWSGLPAWSPFFQVFFCAMGTRCSAPHCTLISHTQPSACSSLCLGWCQAPWFGILGLHSWFFQRSSKLSLQDFPIHTKWFAFWPLSRRPREFPPPPLACPTLLPLLLSSVSELLFHPNYIGPGWSLSSDVHQATSPSQWHCFI